jgi:hypothetical protein
MSRTHRSASRSALVAIRALVALVLTAGCVASAGSETLYVSPDGDDAAPGTKERPLASLAGARDAARGLKATGKVKSITVLFADGTYRIAETVVFGLADSAPEDGTITYSAIPGQRPVFSGSVPITGWRKVKDVPRGLPERARSRVFVADIPEGLKTFHTLFDGLTRLPRARLAGVNPARGLPKGGGARPTDFTTIPFPKGVLRPWHQAADLEVSARCVFPWTMNVIPVTAVDHAKRTVHLAFRSTYPLAYRPVYIENTADGVDRPGRWFVDSRARKVYLWPSQEDDPGGEIVAPRLTELIRVEGRVDRDGPMDVPVRGIVFRGLTFAQGERYTWKKDHRAWCVQHDWEQWDAPSALVRLRGAECCGVEFCRFVASGGTAVRLDLHCQRNRIANCVIEHVGGSGVLLAGYGPGTKDVNRDNEVVNNHIRHVGETYWHSLAIQAWQSGGNRIANNRIHDVPYTGLAITGRIYLGPTNPNRADVYGRGECSGTIRWDEIRAVLGAARAAKAHTLPWKVREPFLHGRKNVLEHNDIRQVMQVMGDGNGIYVSGAGGGNIVRWNRVTDSKGTHLGASIRCDDDQHDTLIEGNLLTDAGVGIGTKGVNHILNNVVVTSGRGRSRGMVYCGRSGAPMRGSRFQRNIVYARRGDDQILLEKPRKHRGRIMVGFQADRNLFWCPANADWGKNYVSAMRRRGIEKNSIVADPQFVDPAKGDFRLKKGSPALKLGFEPIDTAKIGLTGPVGPGALRAR